MASSELNAAQEDALLSSIFARECTLSLRRFGAVGDSESATNISFVKSGIRKLMESMVGASLRKQAQRMVGGDSISKDIFLKLWEKIVDRMGAAAEN